MNKNELNDKLVFAAFTNDFDYFIKLLKNGADINYDNDLSLARFSENNNVEAIEYLIKNGANIHSENDRALWWSSDQGKIESTIFLVKNGANYNRISENLREIKNYKKIQAPINYVLGLNYTYENKSRKEQIIDAVKLNPSIIKDLPQNEIKDIPELQHLIKSDEYGLFESIDKKQLNAKLIDSIVYGTLQMVKNNILDGADIHYNNEYPLKMACEHNKLDVVKYLINLGCDVDKNVDILTKLYNVVNLNIVKIVIKNSKKFLDYRNELIKKLEKRNNEYPYSIIYDYLKNEAIVDNTLGYDYDYSKKSKKNQLIDAVDKSPNIYPFLNKKQKKILSSKYDHLAKSDEYGLFEGLLKFNQFKNQ